MKTRKYVPAKLVSRADLTGVAPYQRLHIFGVPANVEYQSRDKAQAIAYCEERRNARKRDRDRQAQDRDNCLDMNSVRFLIDTGMSLEQARNIVLTLEQSEVN